jgi:twitching motility two-component system response regulator PilG
VATGSAELVQQAVSAAKIGNTAEARRLLVQLTQAEPDNETAWLWLSGVAESPQEALFCLDKVLELNPANERAKANLPGLRLQAGVASCQAGEKDTGRQLLQQVVAQDSGNEQAWLWLAAITDAPDEAIKYLERVLEINPANERAMSGIRYYRSLQPPPPPVTAAWTCPLCWATADESHSQCPQCKAILHLRDPDLFLFNPGLDITKVKEGILRMDYTLAQPPPGTDDFLLHLHMGLGHLNLRQFEEGVTHLRVALQVGKETQELRQQVDELLRHKTQFEATPSSSIREAPVKVPWASLTIMVVETQPAIRKLANLTLKRSGFRVLEAADSYEMGQLLQTGSEPDLVFLQFELPGANGYQLCQMLRNNPRTQQVPIILISTKDGFLHRLRGRWAGCTDFLTKPFAPEDLLGMVRKYCEAKLFPSGKPPSSSLLKLPPV